MASLLFMAFCIWVVVLGLKGVAFRWSQLWRWLCTPWGNNDDLMPTLQGPIGQSWSRDEYRHYSSLAAQTPVPAIPEVMNGMQQALDAEKRTARQIGDDMAEWQHAIDELNRTAEMWTEKAANALSAGRNDLARAAIDERQRTQQRIKDLENDLAEMRRLLTTHSSDIQDLESKLSTVYRRNHLAETRLSAAATSARAREMLYGEDVKDALSRFEQLERAADMAEGRADALALGSETPSDPQAIDAQLAALQPTALPAPKSPSPDETTLAAPSAGFGRKQATP